MKAQPAESSVCGPSRVAHLPEPVQKPRYILISPWPVKAGTGVNNVILGIRDAMLRYYEPVIVSTGWTAPPAGQAWLKLYTPTPPVKNLLAFGVWLIPNLFRLHKVTRGAAAVNAHFIGLQHLPLAILRSLRLCPPLILSVHGSDVTEILASSRLRRALSAWLFSKADLVVACSNALAARVNQVSPKAKVTCIWNAVSPPPEFTFERPLENKYIVCVAGFHFNKGHDLLLEAFQIIARNFEGLDLVLIGNDAPQREAVVAEINKRGLEHRVHVKLDLRHDDVWNWIQNAECLVLPSRNEGLPLSLLEAALVQTPVIATSVGGIPEIIPDGIHGLLCPPEDPVRLAAAMMQTLSNPEAAAHRVRRFYDFARNLTWENVVEAYRSQAGLAAGDLRLKEVV